eukprot:XP_011677951.1 PREDICTED: ankyrin repeat domain-containing protein 50-like [Strongylocentrotus purpuratus]
MAERAANEPAGSDKALLRAALNGHFDLVRYLVGQGAYIETCDIHGQTSLHYASNNGHVDVVKFLIGQRARIDKPSKRGATALLFASGVGDRDIVEYLVGQGAQIDTCDIDVKYLIGQGAQIDNPIKLGATALHFASDAGHRDIVEYLVGQGAQVERGTNNGFTPLHAASTKGHLDLVAYLVGQGAQVERGDNTGWTPLLSASQGGHLDVVKYLVGRGAQVKRGTNNGSTPLQVASRDGQLDVVQYLVGQGAQVERGNNDGLTALLAASSNGHIDVVKYLVGQGAQVERGANNGLTPLLAALSNGHLDVAQYLTSKQAKRKEASPEVSDARSSVPQPFFNLKTIMMADLTIKDSSGGKHAFHKKKARKLEGCHLGGGSFGEVYKATHAVHGDVAVKLAKPGKEDQVKMYKKEARKHENSLICEHIVPIKGFVECEDDACNCGLIGIVMKYMENGSLWDFRTTKWQQHPDLLPLTNRMVYEMSSGMQFLHSKDIIHRDLKLENVLVDGDLHVKIADLGLATNLQTSFGDRCCGTHSHKPPEAFRTDIPNSIMIGTPKYDVYSFAMTLYELLTGIHPYSDREPLMMRIFKLDNQTPDLDPVQKNTPEALIKVMTDSWSYEASDRPDFKGLLILD